MKKIFFIVALACSTTAGAQSSDKTTTIKALVESRNYVFKAMTALPLNGPIRQLNYSYTMTITPTSVVSDLPYYGRAYNVIDPTKGGMNFTSKDFDYAMTPRKKGGWDVVIKQKDAKFDARQLFLTISQDGYASRRVVSLNRDAISYNGTVAASQ